MTAESSTRPWYFRIDAKDGNNFDVLRLAFSLFVMFAHSFDLLGLKSPLAGWTNGHSIGLIGVFGFFFISGFLVTRSFTVSSSLKSFAMKRALRIYPGLWVCLLVTVFALVPLSLALAHGRQGLQEFSSAVPSALRYLGINATLLGVQFEIGNAFAANPLPKGVNGSLWTLPVEMKLYVILAVIGLLGCLTRRKWALGLIALALFLNWILDPTHYRWAGRLFVTETAVLLPALFFLGAACWVFRDAFRVSAGVGWFAAAFLLAGYLTGFWRLPVGLAFPALILALALRAPVLKLPAWLGDLSYGLYLYAFPVQQLLVQQGIGGKQPLALFACSLLTTLPLALLSWHCIERPALALRLRQIARPTPRPT